ncbi:MAG: NAD(P)-dependent oxidoreductase [Bifidobacteriaceae bacterium]|jgi:3-hydroxyisobutyrate dehydrogenase-like beta-hydroxyacid dehydrogenase|nr:NAD(P)-dependent oxidoreductase [Bifidobacteriaceae bacterium]
MNSPPTTVGWLGTGRMGSAMAGRLLAAGTPVTVWNRTTAKTAPLIDQGAGLAESIGDLAACDVVFVMVSTPKDLIQVVSGPQGLLRAPQVPAFIVDCSTVNPETSAQVRAAAGARGTQFLACPISGNPHVVADGGAVIMASGPPQAFDSVKPLLEQIAKAAIWVGEAEQARLVKICHNLYLGLLVQSLSEVTVLAEKSGVPRAAFLDFLNSTVLASPWVQNRTPDLVALDWTPTFTSELLRKDFDLGLAAARTAEVPVPLVAQVHQRIQETIARGHRDDDFLSLFLVQAESAGMEIEAAK